jgi:hypothetical protein
MEQNLTMDTVVRLRVQFSEQSGSTKPVQVIRTVRDLGVTLPDGQAHVPTDAEAKEAVEKDRANPGGGAINALFARYAAMNADTGNPIVALRRALTALIQNGELLEAHKVDGKNYVWQGDENGLAAQWLTDDAQGSVTGVANQEYLNFSGAAVWGNPPGWEKDFAKAIRAAGGDVEDIDDLDLDDEPEDEDRAAGNEDGVLTIRVPFGTRVVRIEIE